jgi:hypothetical protein
MPESTSASTNWKNGCDVGTSAKEPDGGAGLTWRTYPRMIWLIAVEPSRVVLPAAMTYRLRLLSMTTPSAVRSALVT